MQASRSARCVSVLLLASTFVIAGSTYPHDWQRAEAAGARRPNILIIVTDDQREGLSVMPKVRNYFGKQGTNFPNAYSTTPWCCPSRASIMTGRYVHNHGVRTIAPGASDPLNHRTTLQAYLDRAGYRTAMFGKYFNSWPLDKRPPNFDSWALANSDLDSNYEGGLWNINSAIKRVNMYSTTFLRRKAVGFIHRTDAPWFLYVAPHAPHWPATAEDRYEDAPVDGWAPNPAVFEKDRSDKPRFVRRSHKSARHLVRKRQFRTLMSVDDLVGSVFTALRQEGEGRNTIAFFVSDNGFMWGEHGLQGKPYPYLQSIRTPMLARWPGHFTAGKVDSRLVANIDIAPTVMNALGLYQSPRMDGWSLLGSHSRSRLLTEQLGDSNKSPRWRAELTRGGHYIEYFTATGRVIFREYYDLSADPWELKNLFKYGVGRKAGNLRRVLAADKSCSGRACP